MGFEAEVGIDVAKLVRGAKQGAGAVADLNESVGGLDKNLDRAERHLAAAGAALEQFSQSGKAAAASATQQASSIRKLVQAYNDLGKAQGPQAGRGLVGQQNPLLQQRISAIKAEEQYERDFSKMLAQEYQERENRKAQIARDGAIAQQQIQEAARARELADLRRDIERRSALSTQNLISQVNSQSLGKNLGADLLASMRGTAEYTDLIDRSVQGLANQRYALYDVATTFGLISTATLGAATAATVLGGKYDQAFASVARTTQATGSDLQNLRNELIAITTELPTSFEDVTGIATLGAQMDIAQENLAGFTETVSMFASTTDVSVDRAAMGFGRLAQLTKTPQAEISNLGSAIYEVGVNSVATEGEILSVAEQIATAGNLAGFSVQQIVALSGSLASLGVAPEQSRGAIMRIFGDITAAVGEGGEAVAAFAQTAGMANDEFAALWQNDPQAAFSAYLDGLSKMDKALVDVTLKQQGFINVRDRNVITRLANNMDVYTQALSDSARAYSENTALTEGAAIANDNLIDNLTRLGNVLKAIIAEGSQSQFLNGVVKAFANFLDIILQFVQTPVGKALATITTGLAVLVGGVAAVVAGLSLGRATMLAMITAMEQTARSGARATLSTRALALELIRMGGAGPAAAAGLNAVSGAATTSGSRLQVMSAQARAASGAMISTGTAARTAGALIKGALAATGIGLAIVGVTTALETFSTAMKSAEEQAASYLETMGNTSASGLAEAISKDTAAAQEGGRVYREYTAWVGGAGARNEDLADSIRVAAGAQSEAADATAATNTELSNQTRVLGEASNAWLANALASDENIQKLWEQKDLLNALGFDMKTFVERTMAAPGGGSAYFKELLTDMAAAGGYTEEFGRKANVTREQFITMTNDLQTALDAYQVTVDSTLTKEEVRTQVLEALGVESDEAAASTENLGNKMSELATASLDSINGVVAVQNAVNDLGASLGENGNSFDAFTEGGRENLQALSGVISAMADQAGDDSMLLAQNLGGLVGQLQQYGVDTGNELSFVGDMLNQLVGNQWGLDFNSAPARADIQAFINDAIRAIQVRATLERAAAAARAATMTNPILKAANAATATATGAVYQGQINALKNFQSSIGSSNSAVQGLGKSMQQGFGRGAKAADRAAKGTKGIGDNAKKAQQEVRTLTDYASDLESVWKRAFDIRFGPAQAADDTANALQKMRDEIESNNRALADARLRVQELNAELSSLRADNQTLGYQLQVAIEYGDELRAAEIRAKMAENNAELAKTEQDKTKAQQEANKAQDALNLSLTGNTQGARDNREAVLALLQSYQGQINALASSGMSTDQLKRKTDELRAEFIRQLTQMGYNRAEVGQYAVAFDYLTAAINRVPRNITVAANTNPAQQALNEFVARNNGRTINMRANVSAPSSIGGGAYNASGINVGSGGIKTPNIAVRDPLQLNGGYAPGWKPGSYAKGGPIMGSYASGGRVPGVTPTNRNVDNVLAKGPNGMLAIQSGEYVVRSKAVDMYGLPFMNALNNMQISPMAFGGPVSGGGSGTAGIQLVELLPNQLAQIARMVSTQVYLDGKSITEATAQGNAQATTRGRG